MFLNEDTNNLLSETTETKEGNQLIVEGIILDALAEAGLSYLDEDTAFELLKEDLLSEKNIIRFDKKTKRKHNTNRAVLVIAKEKNDRDFKKLVKVMKMRRILLNRLQNKYGSKAAIRAKQAEKTGTLSKIVAKIKKGSVRKKDL